MGFARNFFIWLLGGVSRVAATSLVLALSAVIFGFSPTKFFETVMASFFSVPHFWLDTLWLRAAIVLVGMLVIGLVLLITHRNRKVEITNKPISIAPPIIIQTTPHLSAKEAMWMALGQTHAPKREVWLSDAIWRAHIGKWEPRPTELPEDTAVYTDVMEIAKLVRQYAFEGNLTIWGKKDGDHLWREIPRVFWEDHTLNYLFVFQDEPERLRVDGTSRFNSSSNWNEFMTSKTQIEELWPQKTVVTKHMVSNLEVDQIRGQVGTLAEALLSYEKFEYQRGRVLESFSNIRISDHVLWTDPSLKQLRRDFLNRCGIMIDDKKHPTDRAEGEILRTEIKNLAQSIDSEIKAWLLENT